LQAIIKVRHYSNKIWQAYRYWLQQFQTITKNKDANLLDMDDLTSSGYEQTGCCIQSESGV
jgi:valyl-tRNA synthetase